MLGSNWERMLPAWMVRADRSSDANDPLWTCARSVDLAIWRNRGRGIPGNRLVEATIRAFRGPFATGTRCWGCLASTHHAGDWRSCSRGATMRDSSFWSVAVSRVLSTYAIVIFAMLWVGFAIALAVNREWLDLLWNWVGALPTVAEIIVWVVFLPIMTGLWIWESSWPVLVNLLAFAGIVVWTFLAVSSFLRAVR
jgi:hypothetical protein